MAGEAGPSKADAKEEDADSFVSEMVEESEAGGTLSGYALQSWVVDFPWVQRCSEVQFMWHICGIISVMSASKYAWDSAFFDVGSWGIMGMYRVNMDQTTVTRSTRIENSSATTPGIKLDPLVI